MIWEILFYYHNYIFHVGAIPQTYTCTVYDVPIQDVPDTITGDIADEEDCPVTKSCVFSSVVLSSYVTKNYVKCGTVC